MIETSTCLVLGAGASAPYGFPSGADLKNEILGGAATPNHRLMNALTQAGHSRDELRKLVQALLDSAQPSIDVFLANRPSLLEPGKAAIASVLIHYENHGTLAAPIQREDHWYAYLWQQLQEGGSSAFGGNKLSVITFNYDRSLEWFLVTAYANSFGVELEEA